MSKAHRPPTSRPAEGREGDSPSWIPNSTRESAGDAAHRIARAIPHRVYRKPEEGVAPPDQDEDEEKEAKAEGSSDEEEKDSAEAKDPGDKDAVAEPAGEEKAPEIGAKLEGVGRKVFLSRMPNPDEVEQRRQMWGETYGVENRVQPGQGGGGQRQVAELPQNMRTAREITGWLAQNGFALDRQAGSHQQWRGPNGGMVTVAMHTGDIAPGTLSSIRRQIRAAQ